jgi:hypothetical protein
MYQAWVDLCIIVFSCMASGAIGVYVGEWLVRKEKDLKVE